MPPVIVQLTSASASPVIVTVKEVAVVPLTLAGAVTAGAAGAEVSITSGLGAVTFP